MAYVGRFAPSPTGPLHFGSLIAAVASYLEARKHQGHWLLRMEDLDKPREMPGATDHILHTLEAFGFKWDGPVIYQSRRSDAYEAALNDLKQQQRIYPCACTRKEIADSVTSRRGIDGLIYPGTCKHGLPAGKNARAWRISVENRDIIFQDAIQGVITQNLVTQVGDFVLKRADGLYAYQLAVVVDDAEQKVTHILRGADLLDSTARQIYLQELFAIPTPHYAHIPVACNPDGEKLSKQTLAKAVTVENASQLLYQVLCFLGQNPPASMQQAPVDTIWQWANEHWKIENIPKTRMQTDISASKN